MKKGKIVVVDDSIVNLKLVHDVLSTEGYTVVMQKEAVKAHQICLIEQPDLILLDIIMPDGNGIQICEGLKQDAQTSDIPVIFLSAKTESDSLIDAFGVGGVDYLTKPFNFKELVARVNTHVQLKKSLQTIKSQADELKSLAHAKNRAYEFASFATENVYQYFKQIESTVINKINLPENELQQLNQVKNSMGLQLRNLEFWLNFKAGKVRLNKESFEVNSIVQEYLHAFQNVFTKNQTKASLDFLYQNVQLTGDLAYIKLALLNLYNFVGTKLNDGHLKITVGVLNSVCYVNFEANKSILSNVELAYLKADFGVKSDEFKNKEVYLGLRIIQAICDLHYGEFKVNLSDNLTNFRIEFTK